MEVVTTTECDEANSSKILCCLCGALIVPNQSNMCIGCLRAQIDISEGIPKSAVVYFCKSCERYQQDQGKWIRAELESNDLLTLCLKKLKGLNKVEMVDAAFVWTEPHSRRIKVKLTIQKEVAGGDTLRHVFVVEYVVNTQMCDLCHRIEAKDFWKAKVQVRQRLEHKKTLLYLEQLLSKNLSQFNCTKTKPLGEGIDFFFDRCDDARKIVEFIQKSIPCRYSMSQQLISHDNRSNIYNYKYTFSVEIVPICNGDIVCLPRTTSKALGNIGRLCICTRVTHNIYLINPFTLKSSEMNATIYFRAPFKSITNSKRLTEYMVMNIEQLDKMVTDKSAEPDTEGGGKYALADVWLVKSSELGSSDTEIHCRTHLGNLLSPGDTVLGFDLANANLNNAELDDYQQDQGDRIPDVILLKKHYIES
jgi:nonsense-mediated mRNA decay protein 3